MSEFRGDGVRAEGGGADGARGGSIGDVGSRGGGIVRVGVEVREQDEVTGGAGGEEHLHESHGVDGRSPDEDRAGAELAQGAEDEEGFEPERRGDGARGEVKRERGVDAHGEDVARDLRVGETLDVREVGDWERYEVRDEVDARGGGVRLWKPRGGAVGPGS